MSDSNSVKEEIQRLQEKYNLTYVYPNTILISYPKSGRTWLRMMLAKMMLLSFDKITNDKYEIFPSLHLTYKELKERFKTDYKDLNIIFLHRHPADVAISHYKEMTTSKRSGLWTDASLSEFIRDKSYGIEQIIEYNNKWLEKGGNFNRFLMLSYSMLHQDAHACLAAIATTIGLPTTKEDIEAAIKYGEFDNMKKIESGEQENLLQYYKGTFARGDTGRARIGKCNNYINVLEEKDKEFVDECMNESNIIYSLEEEQ